MCVTEHSVASGSHADSKDSIHSHSDHREVELGKCIHYEPLMTDREDRV